MLACDKTDSSAVSEKCRFRDEDLHSLSLLSVLLTNICRVIKCQYEVERNICIITTPSLPLFRILYSEVRHDQHHLTIQVQSI